MLLDAVRSFMPPGVAGAIRETSLHRSRAPSIARPPEDPIAIVRSSGVISTMPGWRQDPRPAILEAHGALVWFEGVHIEPRSLDAGFVTGPLTFTIRAFNTSRFRAVVAYEYLVEGEEGVDLNPPPTFDIHLPSTGVTTFSLEVTEEGPPQFENRVIVRFVGWLDEQTDIAVVGRRVVPFPIDPSGEIEEGYAYLTRILTSGADAEQRAALRELPRRQWSFEFVLARSEARLMQSLIHGWQQRAFGLPVWYDETVLDSPVGIGDLALACDTEQRIWGELAILWADPWTYEVVRIDSISPTGIALELPLVSAWPAGARVYPIHFARMRAQEVIEWRGLEVGVMRAEFSGEDWSA